MNKNCFVIMPFSETTEKHDKAYWTEFFKTIEKIMSEQGYNCTRSEVGPYKLFSNIVKNIDDSDIVIAVLTDFNANVWYELGIRHTLKSGTIMLLQEGQKAPFDICDFGIIFYKDSIGLERYLENKIKEYLDKLDDSALDSPVIYSLNHKSRNNFEKKFDEMQQLLWKLIDEIPKNKEVESKSAVRQNRVLWVDDYPINNEMVINLFEDKNIRFDIAITTKQGVELYKRGLYDLVITDMGRGRESDAGLTLLKELKSLHCQTPIVVYASKRAIERYGEEAKKLGAYMVTSGIGSIMSIISDVLDVSEE